MTLDFYARRSLSSNTQWRSRICKCIKQIRFVSTEIALVSTSWTASSLEARALIVSGSAKGCKSNLHNRLILSEHFRHDQGAEWAPVT
ncbi:hypothetical protein KC324_g43 [Hortaea werneckii]|nr:hypothetical protein KC324_g43 [Hortaea werneckii]